MQTLEKPTVVLLLELLVAAAILAAIKTWAKSNATHELPDLFDQALTMQDHELSLPHA